MGSSGTPIDPANEFVGKPLQPDLIDRLATVYWPRLCAILVGRGYAAEVAEDVVQAAFQRLLVRASEGTPRVIESNPLQFLIALCRNELPQQTRSTPSDGELHSGISDPSQRKPSSVVQAVERWDRVKDAIDELPPEQRQVFHLHEVEGLSFKDIAARLGKTPDAHKEIYARARQKLRQRAKQVHSMSSMIPEKDRYTRTPKSRSSALAAIDSMPREAREVLQEKYVTRRSGEEAAMSLGLTPERHAELLAQAEEFFSIEYAITLPDELVTALQWGAKRAGEDD